MKIDAEIKKADDAIVQSLKFMEGIDVYRRQALEVIMRMCYYKGMLVSTKERERLHQLFMQEDEEDES